MCSRSRADNRSSTYLSVFSQILTRLHDTIALTQASTAGGHLMAGWPHTARVSSPATMFMAPSTLFARVLSLACAARSRADIRMAPLVPLVPLVGGELLVPPPPQTYRAYPL